MWCGGVRILQASGALAGLENDIIDTADIPREIHASPAAGSTLNVPGTPQYRRKGIIPAVSASLPKLHLVDLAFFARGLFSMCRQCARASRSMQFCIYATTAYQPHATDIIQLYSRLVIRLVISLESGAHMHARTHVCLHT